MLQAEAAARPRRGDAGARPLMARDIVGLLRDTFSEWRADNALRLGAALAYYAVFSLAPLLIVAIAIAGLVFERQEARAQIVADITNLIGAEGAAATSAMIQHALAPTSGMVAAAISLGVILLGASGAFAELQQGLNEIWKVRLPANRGMLAVLQHRLTSFFMVLGVGLLFLLSLLVNAAIAALDRWFATEVPALDSILALTHFVLSLGLGTVLFAMIFKFLPDVQIAWRDTWISAALTALLFFVGQLVIRLYLSHSAVASPFGAAGSLVIILVWVYYSSQILFFGAEFTKVYTKKHGSHATPAVAAPSADIPLKQ